MQNESLFKDILSEWENKRFPHKNIKVIAQDYKAESYVTEIIYLKSKENIDIFMDFGGVFFWEYWKYNTPDGEIIKFLLFNISKKTISPVTQYSMVLALTSCYKNHNIYKRAIFNKLNQLIDKNKEDLSESIIEQIYEAIY